MKTSRLLLRFVTQCICRYTTWFILIVNTSELSTHSSNVNADQLSTDAEERELYWPRCLRWKRFIFIVWVRLSLAISVRTLFFFHITKRKKNDSEFSDVRFLRKITGFFPNIEENKMHFYVNKKCSDIQRRHSMEPVSSGFVSFVSKQQSDDKSKNAYTQIMCMKRPTTKHNACFTIVCCVYAVSWLRISVKKVTFTQKEKLIAGGKRERHDFYCTVYSRRLMNISVISRVCELSLT